MRQFVDRAISPRRFFVSLLATFATIALAVAALGIYGVISYDVRPRTREIALRVALGASALDVQRAALRQTARLALIGR
jgi:ABC-type antimicrobial peptide transport system permease subunit